MNYTESDFEAAYRLNRRACWVLGALFVVAAVGYTIHYGSLP